MLSDTLAFLDTLTHPADAVPAHLALWTANVAADGDLDALVDLVLRAAA